MCLVRALNLRITSQSDDPLVVPVDHRSDKIVLIQMEKLDEQVSKPDGFLRGLRLPHVLGLTRRQSYHKLVLGWPADGAAANIKYVTRGGASGCEVSSPVGISVSRQGPNFSREY
jgi:hypothetical protein